MTKNITSRLENVGRMIRSRGETMVPPKEITIRLTIIGAIFGLMMATGYADDDFTNLETTLEGIGNFISVIVLGIAFPNGAYGFLQYMTAGSNVDQDEKGRKRIRDTFIALAGVALFQLAINVYSSFVDLDPQGPDGDMIYTAAMSVYDVGMTAVIALV